MTGLDARLLEAHDQGDGAALVSLYIEAADQAATETARGFYLTHAHVFALEMGHPDTAKLRQALIDMNRESPL
jgi:hypothetical protein